MVVVVVIELMVVVVVVIPSPVLCPLDPEAQQMERFSVDPTAQANGLGKCGCSLDPQDWDDVG
jgi:hypothetical protein